MYKAFTLTAKPIFRAGEPSVRKQELMRALAWLRRHAPSDAVVLANQYDGNWIVAFAGKRVIASSKVYPSEAQETAARYRDIARFFYAPDEEAVKPLLARYQIDYVFLSNEFPISLCQYANACHLYTGNALTPEGRERTLLGQFRSRAKFSQFELIWDSPNVQIYRVRNTKAQGNPCRLSAEEWATALRIAHEGLRSLFEPGVLSPDGGLAQQCSVDATILAGGKVRGSIIILDRPLGQAIFESVRASARDRRYAPIRQDELPSIRFVVSVFSTEELIPENTSRISRTTIDPERVYVVRKGPAAGFLLPFSFAVRSFATGQDFLSALCQKARFGAECWRDAEVKVYSAPVDAVVELERGTPAALRGALPVPDDTDKFSNGLLRARATLARDWIYSMMRRSVIFRARLNPHNPEEELDSKREDVLGLATTWSLLELAQKMPDARAVTYAKKKSDEFEQLLRSGETLSAAKLVYGGLVNLALWEITHQSLYNSRAVSYASVISELARSKQSLPQSFRLVNEELRIVGDQDDWFTTKAAMYFLSRMLQIRTDADMRSLALQWRDVFKKEFRRNRIVHSDALSLAEWAWLVNAFRELFSVTRDPQDGEFALEVADFLLDYQIRNGSLSQDGGFQNTPAQMYAYARGSGKAAEALIAAASVARELGLDDGRYLEGFRRVMRWLMVLQYTRDTAYLVPETYMPLAVGAIRADRIDPTAPIDAAAHFIIAAAEYLR